MPPNTIIAADIEPLLDLRAISTRLYHQKIAGLIQQAWEQLGYVVVVSGAKISNDVHLAGRKTRQDSKLALWLSDHDQQQTAETDEYLDVSGDDPREIAAHINKAIIRQWSGSSPF